MSSAVTAVWQHRSLLRALVIREVQNRYTGSIAGLLWALVHPLLMLGIYGVVFEYVFRVKVPTLAANQPYILFVAVALWPWLAFQESVTRACLSVQNNAALVKKVAFPHELLVYSAVVAGFMVHMAGFAVVIVALMVLGFSVKLWALPTVLLISALLLLSAVAVGLFLGAMQVFVKDIEQLLSQVLSVLFYATPVLYGMSSVPAWLAQAMQWNPLVHFLEGIRGALLSGDNLALLPAGLMVTGVLLLFFACRRVFLKLSPHFEDML